MGPLFAKRLRFLLLSVGLHLLGAAGLLGLLAEPPALPPPPAQAHELTLVELALPVAREMETPLPRPAVQQPTPTPSPQPPRLTPRRPPVPLAQPPTSAPGSTSPDPESEGQPLDALDLSMRDEAPPPASGPRTPSPPPANEPSAAQPPDDRALERRWNALLADELAQQNQRDGRVAPYLFDLQRDAEQLFSPSWELAEGDRAQLGTLSHSTKDFVRALGSRYLEQLAQSQRPDDPEDRPPSMLDQYQAMLRAAADGAARLSCDLCATLRWQLPTRIAVRRSSGRAPFDDLAHLALERTLRTRPPGRELPPQRACYRFEAIFFQMPPLPMAGCSFDESELSLSCYYPTKKILRPSVKLLDAQPLAAPSTGG